MCFSLPKLALGSSDLSTMIGPMKGGSPFGGGMGGSMEGATS